MNEELTLDDILDCPDLSWRQQRVLARKHFHLTSRQLEEVLPAPDYIVICKEEK